MGMIGYMASSLVMAHNSVTKAKNVDFHNGDVVSFTLTGNAVIAQ